jgi:hypothetical protein
LAAWGGARRAEDYPEPLHEVWEENYDPLVWFRSMLTQFVYNGFGATGFNYVVAYREFDDMELTGTKLDEWKWKLKVMEREALSHINAK